MAEFEGVKVLQSITAIGWVPHHIVRGSSHQHLQRPGLPDFNWAFHNSDEIGPKMLARIAKQTGLKPESVTVGLPS